MSLLINPRRKALEAAISRANERANPPRVTTRTARLSLSVIDQIRKSKSGLVEEDGGAVANKYRFSCQSSYVVAAWWTDGRGRKHVRIDGMRVSARHCAYGNGNATSHIRTPGWTAVYPERDAKRAAALVERTKRAINRVGSNDRDDWYARQERILARLRQLNWGTGSADTAAEYVRRWSSGLDGSSVSRIAETVEAFELKVQLEQMGNPPTDDFRRIWDPVLVAVGAGGRSLLIADDAKRPTLVQVVVRDATTGHRHHISVPPKFGTPTSKTFQKIVAQQGKSGLVQAAVAWTFNLESHEYAPAVEA